MRIIEMGTDLAYHRALLKYEESIRAPNDTQREHSLREAIAILESIRADSLMTADALHLLGLCWYGIPNGRESLDKANDAFAAALAVDPNHRSWFTLN